MDKDSNPVARLIRQVTQGQETTLDVVKDIVGDGDEKAPRTILSVINRQVNPEQPDEPKKARSPRRAHTFHTAETLTAYLEKHTGDNVVCLMDVDQQAAVIVLDETAKDGFETVTLRPMPHPIYREWLTVIGGFNRLKIVALFLLKHRTQIVEPDGRELALTFAQVRVSKDVEMWAGLGNGAVNGVKVKTTVEGASQDNVVQLPEQVTIAIPLFVGQSPTQLTLDLTVDTVNEEVGLHITAPTLLDAVTANFQAMVDAITVSLPNAVVGLGAMEYDNWHTVRSQQ